MGLIAPVGAEFAAELLDPLAAAGVDTSGVRRLKGYISLNFSLSLAFYMSIRVCVRARVCVYVRACVRVCISACVRM